MFKKLASASLFNFFSVGLTVAHAADAPTLTNVYSSGGTQMITVDCDIQANGKLDCHFTQVLLSPGEKDTSPSERENEVGKILSQFGKEEPAPKNCSLFTTVHNALVSGEPPTSLDDIPGVSDKKGFQQGMDEMLLAPQKQRDDMVLSMGLLADMCENPSKSTAEKIVDHQIEKESRTCNVWSNTYTHEFEKDAQGRWVSTEGPQGQCGVVYVSVLEQEGDYPTLWNYWTRKIVTNKEGGSDLLLQCEELDEEVQTYTWRSDETFHGCDYIKFGLF